MLCTSCKIEITSRSHYTSPLHTLNTQRKLCNIPPLSELPEESLPNTKNDIKSKKELKKETKHIIYKNISQEQPHNFDSKMFNTLECYICDTIFSTEDEITNHLSEHDIEFSYYKDHVVKKECLFCSSVVRNVISYKQHIKKHFIDCLNVNGAYAQLDSGKMIGNRNYVRYFNQTLRKVEKNESNLVKVEEFRKESKALNEEKKNVLKISISMNAQKHFRAHWLQ
ncbi:hypothetical protein COBT_001962 [Conglomerata obtusa]